jgi:hypothetical protein
MMLVTAQTAIAGETALGELGSLSGIENHASIPESKTNYSQETAGMKNVIWQHRNLTSADSVSIAIDYLPQYIDDGYGNSHTIASPLWINVSNNLFPSDAVSVVMINRDVSGGESTTKSVDLRFENGKFTASLSGFTVFRFHCESPVFSQNNNTWYCQRGSERITDYSQEIAIVINGQRWLTDPISGTHNFKLKL